MKIAVECQSPLLQKSLEIFLSKHLSSAKHCEILIRDVKCLEDERCFYISSDSGADLVKPFSKSQLIMALENKYEKLYKTVAKKKGLKESKEPKVENLDFEILEKRIDLLTQEYQKNILNVVRAFYEK